MKNVPRIVEQGSIGAPEFRESALESRAPRKQLCVSR